MVNNGDINQKILNLQNDIEFEINKIKYNNSNILSLSVNALESINTRLILILFKNRRNNGLEKSLNMVQYY